MGTKKARCTVEGCEKQAWKEGMCYHHFHKAKKDKEIPQPTTETMTPPPTVETPPEPARLSIMDRVSIVDTPLSKPGFYLDFTGKEDLLKAYKSLSEDLNNDTICLIELSIAGVLRRVA